MRQKYETFQVNYPEGEITKEEFLKTMKVNLNYRVFNKEGHKVLGY